MQRRNHYEVAFEAYLRDRRMPYVAVDETKRALFTGSQLKSFDFVVYSRGGPNLLVDVKGRKATGNGSLQTWATQRDVDDLWQWERVFGDGFKAVFAFVFEVDPVLAPPPGYFAHPKLLADDDDSATGRRHYLMLSVSLADYRDRMARRSEKWGTVSVPADAFRQLARPVDALL